MAELVVARAIMRGAAAALTGRGLSSADEQLVLGAAIVGTIKMVDQELVPGFLSLVHAKSIYLADYWRIARCDEIPDTLKLPVFDCAVNQGKSAAVKTLQRAARVKDDGDFGPITMKAVWANEAETWQRFMAKRAIRYTEAPTFWKHGDGWMMRRQGREGAGVTAQVTDERTLYVDRPGPCDP